MKSISIMLFVLMIVAFLFGCIMPRPGVVLTARTNLSLYSKRVDTGEYRDANCEIQKGQDFNLVPKGKIRTDFSKIVIYQVQAVEGDFGCKADKVFISPTIPYFFSFYKK